MQKFKDFVSEMRQLQWTVNYGDQEQLRNTKMKKLVYKVMNSMILLQLFVIVTFVVSQEIASPKKSTEKNQIQRIFNEEHEDHHEEDDHDIDNHDHNYNETCWSLQNLLLLVVSWLFFGGALETDFLFV